MVRFTFPYNFPFAFFLLISVEFFLVRPFFLTNFIHSYNPFITFSLVFFGVFCLFPCFHVFVASANCFSHFFGFWFISVFSCFCSLSADGSRCSNNVSPIFHLFHSVCWKQQKKYKIWNVIVGVDSFEWKQRIDSVNCENEPHTIQLRRGYNSPLSPSKKWHSSSSINIGWMKNNMYAWLSDCYIWTRIFEQLWHHLI